MRRKVLGDEHGKGGLQAVIHAEYFVHVAVKEVELMDDATQKELDARLGGLGVRGIDGVCLHPLVVGKGALFHG